MEVFSIKRLKEAGRFLRCYVKKEGRIGGGG
jgi:hypothetical protein